MKVAGPRIEVSFEEILKEAGEWAGKPFPPRHDPVTAAEARKVKVEAAPETSEDW